MTSSEDLFLDRYQKLNERQKAAVDHIYGPVMVIAGPGTGKTEVLSMRIANLMRSEAQVQPHEILCLTYTDEATASMRRRLVQIIGAAAHKVNIFTFHAFCNTVIQNNSEIFGMRSLQPLTDLERTELLYKMLDELPSGHALRKLSGKIYFDVRKISNLFDLMKREYLPGKYISDAIDLYLNELPQREGYTYKNNGKNYKKGDVKQALIDEEARKMEGTRAAALLFDRYEQMMKEMGRYDFNDMIIWVLDAFRDNPALLQSYQERYQFILVDEFQDTNGSQSRLLNYLASYWDDPNIFVVGDDDQGVYEFQGARIRNIVDFYEQYRESVSIIVLPHNYRSSQPILDKAMATIQNNEQRLINQLRDLNLDKNIVASGERFKDGDNSVQPVVTVYNNVTQEECDIVLQIDQLKRAGVPLNHVAVLYAQHKQANNIMAVMDRLDIPFNAKRKVNILKEPLIEQIMMVLRYLTDEKKKPFEGEAALFELMHAPYFGISPTDTAQVALYLQHVRKEKGPTRWRLVLNDVLLLESLGLKSAKAMARLGVCLDNWEQQQQSLPLPLLIEKIMHEGGIVAHQVQSTDHVWNIQMLYTFFDFVKETYSRNQKIKPAGLIDIVNRMNDESLELQLQKVVQNENGVHFYTAHSSKGNEFEYVFLVGCTKNFWEDKKGSNNEYKLPDTITATADDGQKSSKIEVARRLFYVALTRAKKYLFISYAKHDSAGKPIDNSVFIDEISVPEDRIDKMVATDELVRFMETAIAPLPEYRIKMANAQWIDRELQQLVMSASTLTKFLHCPLTFYYERILKVPTQKSDALAFGSAVHTALERMFVEMKNNKGVFPDKEQVLAYFKSALFSEGSSFPPAQFDRRMEQGNTLLADYYDHYINSFHKDVEIELTVQRYLLDGVPVTGKIDKLELDGDTCRVIDYKTGDPERSALANVAPPNDKEPLGGDYWRQMVFYKLLLEHAEDRPRKVTSGMFDYIQPGKGGVYKQLYVPVFEQDEAIVRAQLKDVYNRIMNHEFDRGCGEESCHWCNFAKRYELIRTDANAVIELDDN